MMLELKMRLNFQIERILPLIRINAWSKMFLAGPEMCQHSLALNQ